jgi:hypothetical protein
MQTLTDGLAQAVAPVHTSVRARSIARESAGVWRISLGPSAADTLAARAIVLAVPAESVAEESESRTPARRPVRAERAAQPPTRKARAATTRTAAPGAMRGRLEAFVSAHTPGWDHQAWLGLLTELRDAGMDVTDEAGIGMALERERLHRLLGDAPGATRSAVTRLVKRFGSVGALLQVNAGSLNGYYAHSNPGAEGLAWAMVEHRLVDIISTDHHGMRRAGVSLLEAFEALTARGERELAERVLARAPDQVARATRNGDVGSISSPPGAGSSRSP